MIEIALRVETVGDRWQVSTGSVREHVPPLTDEDLQKAIDRVTAKGGGRSTPEDARTWDGFLDYLTPGRDWSPGRTLLESVGRLVHDHLIRGKVATSVSNRLAAAGEARQVRLTVHVFEGEEEGLLVRLPFELLVRDASFWLRTPETTGTRLPPESEPCAVQLGPRSSVIVAAAHLDDRAPSATELEQHVKQIQSLLEDEGFHCRPLLACTPEALGAALREGCDALYVVAHGTEDFELRGRLHLHGGTVSGSQLGEWLEAAGREGRRRVECVLLCACSSAAAPGRPGTMGMAAHLASGSRRAKAALGFRAPVAVSWAFRFMAAVFEHVTRGASVEVAVALARRAQPDADPQWALASLFTYAASPAASGHRAAWRRTEAPMMGSASGSPRSLLPIEPRPYFTGRGEELRRLRAWRRAPGAAIVTAMSGEGGVGKTELARKLAYEAYDDGNAVIWLERPDRNVGGSMVTLIRQVEPGFQVSGAANLEALRAKLTEAFAGSTGLLVLDDVEDVAAVDTLTPGPTWNLLVTTRRRHLLPSTVEVEVAPLDREDAVELLARVARGDEPFAGADRAAAAALIEDLGGLPLAIEIAGELVRRGHDLDDVRRMIRTNHGADLLARIDRIIERSLAQLPAGDEEAWAFVAAMPMVGATAEETAQGLDEPVGPASRRLFRLRQANLLRHRLEDDRYSMHALAREAARARSQAKARWQDMLARSAKVLLSVAEWCHAPIGYNTDEAIRRWNERGRALLATVDPTAWPVGSAAGQDVAQIVWLTDSFLGMEEMPTERARTLSAAITRAIDQRTVGILMQVRGETRARLDDLLGAREDFDKAISCLAWAGDQLNLAHALRLRGDLHARQDLDAEASADYDDATALFESVRDTPGLAHLQLQRGYLRARRGDLAGAEAAHTWCIEAYTRVRDGLGIANACLARGVVRHARGHREGAIEDLSEARDRYMALDNRLGLAQVKRQLGILLAEDGQPHAARRLIEEAVADSRAVQDGLGVSSSLARLAWVLAMMGDHEGARAAAAEAEPVAQRAANQPALDLLAHVRALEHDSE